MAAGIHALGVVSLLEAFRAGRVSVVAATEHYLERIARHDPVLKAFTHVDAAGARSAAAESAARFDSGTARALEGVPVQAAMRLSLHRSAAQALRYYGDVDIALNPATALLGE